MFLRHHPSLTLILKRNFVSPVEISATLISVYPLYSMYFQFRKDVSRLPNIKLDIILKASPASREFFEHSTSVRFESSSTVASASLTTINVTPTMHNAWDNLRCMNEHTDLPWPHLTTTDAILTWSCPRNQQIFGYPSPLVSMLSAGGQLWRGTKEAGGAVRHWKKR